MDCGDDGGGLRDLSKGVEVVGGRVREEVVKDGSGINGGGGNGFPCFSGGVDSCNPSGMERWGGRVVGGYHIRSSRSCCRVSLAGRLLPFLAVRTVYGPTPCAELLLEGVPTFYGRRRVTRSERR